MPWTVPAPAPADGPTVGEDRPVLEGYLDFQRTNFQNICAGLSPEQLATRPLPSELCLLGLMNHLAKVERTWFRIRAAGEDVPSLYPLGTSEDFDDDDPDGAQQAFEVWLGEVDGARRAVAGLAWDHVLRDKDGAALSLGFTTLHVTMEYARHNGHADLIREALDGVTGR